MSTHKGQSNSVDMVVSFIAFALMLAFLLAFWFNGLQSANSAISRNRMEHELLSASDTLLKGPGFPTNWEANNSNVTTIGLAREPNMLYAAKVSNFTNLSYTNIKSLLGLSYEFHFYVQDLSGNLLYEAGNSSSGTVSVSIMRFAILDGQPVKMRVVAHD